MVHARAGVGDLVHRRADPLGEHVRRALHAVAQAGHFDVGVGLHGLAKHRHGVRVVQKHRVGAIFFNVGANVEHQRNIAQRAENAGHAAGVANVDIHAVFLRNFDIVAPHVNVAVEHRAEHAIGAGERFGAAERGRHLRGLARSVHNLLHAAANALEPVGVDIHQRDLGILKRRKREQIAHHVAREREAACADKRKFFHDRSSFRFWFECVIIIPLRAAHRNGAGG